MTASPSPSEPLFVRGRIIRKRKHHNGVGYAIKPLAGDDGGNIENASLKNHPASASGNQQESGLTLSHDNIQPNQQTKSNIPPVLVLVPRNHQCVKWCFVGAVVLVDLKKTMMDDSLSQEEKKDDDRVETASQNGTSKNGNTDSGDAATANNKGHRKNLRDAERVELIQCSPDPNAIVHCLEMVVKGDLTLSSFPTAAIQDVDQVKQLLAASPKDEDRRKRILDISRDLQVIGTNPESHYQYHHPEAKKYGTSKNGGKPRIKRRYWYVLEEMEKVVTVIEPLQKESLTSTENALSRGLNVQALQKHLETQAIPAEEVFSVPSETTTTTTGEEAMVWNVPNVNAMSNNHPISRLDYLKQKKFPQVRWLLQKLEYVLKHTIIPNDVKNDETSDGLVAPKGANEPRKVRVLDVGGGRGDLAVAMAQSFPNIHVTVVDVNESSLQAAKAFAEHVMGKKQADEQTTFRCADFAALARDMMEQSDETNAFDVVIAWHACGDLSDFALEFAMETNASFIICPCCFTKRYIQGFEPKWIGDYIGGKGFVCPEVSTPPAPAPEPLTESLEKDIYTVQRIAEINEHSEVSRRAMLLVNSMRLISLERQQDHLYRSHDDDEGKIDTSSIAAGGLALSLEEYDLKHSSKNLVLVGIQK